jgi:hypothetical protein
VLFRSMVLAHALILPGRGRRRIVTRQSDNPATLGGTVSEATSAKDFTRAHRRCEAGLSMSRPRHGIIKLTAGRDVCYVKAVSMLEIYCC